MPTPPGARRVLFPGSSATILAVFPAGGPDLTPPLPALAPRALHPCAPATPLRPALSLPRHP
eukprot:6273245-Lingulodinium_polyedra.AAC.1